MLYPQILSAHAKDLVHVTSAMYIIPNRHSLGMASVLCGKQARAVGVKATQTLCNQVGRSLFRDCAITNTDQVFRNESGGPPLSLDTGLRLEIKDFAPEDLAEGISDSFLIESALLCRFLCEAEQKEQNIKRQRGIIHHMIPGARKRRREETPPEEVSSDDGHTNDGRRESDDNSSYKSSQSQLDTKQHRDLRFG
jgi:hypothetical protein